MVATTKTADSPFKDSGRARNFGPHPNRDLRVANPSTRNRQSSVDGELQGSRQPAVLYSSVAAPAVPGLKRRRSSWLFGSLLMLALCSFSDAWAEKHALLIGVSTYDYAAVKTGVIPLTYPRFDVQELEISLKDKGYKVTPLIDEGARREHVLTAFMKLREEVEEDDLFVLFFAGHGLRDSTIGKTYWLTYDTKLDLLDDNGIRLSHLMDYVSDIRAKRKLILLDHCYSGEVVLDTSAPGNARRLGGASPRIDRAGTRGLVPVQEIGAMAERGGGGVVVLAAARNEAYEHDDYGNGLLTEAVLKAIDSREADSEAKDGKLSVFELTSYVRKKMKELSENIGVTQEPVLKVKAEDVDQWVLLDLPEMGPSPEERRQESEALRRKYKSHLARWVTKNPPWIEMRVKFSAYAVLDRWVVSVGEQKKLSIEDEKAVRSLRTNMEALENDDVPEPIVADAINFELKEVFGIR